MADPQIDEAVACSSCGEAKALADFYIRKSGPRAGDVQQPCRPCLLAARRTPEFRARRQARRRRPAGDVTRTCVHCSQVFTFRWEPSEGRRGPGNWRSVCDLCLRHASRRLTYGLTGPQVETLLARGACAICGEAARLHVDHCHSTGAVRGVLCGPCNVALGHFRDRPELMERAADYVRRGGFGA